MFDVAIIGGGVIGGATLRELTKYNLKVCLLEKAGDVCMGASKANSGIVHAGFDAPCGSLKAKFNVLGSKMMPEYARALGVKYLNNGSLVVAFSEEENKTLSVLKKRGEDNGVTGLKLLSKEELFATEPNVSREATGALLAETGAQVFFSHELCARYFTYTDREGAAHFVLFDDADTLAAKLAQLTGCGVQTVFALYPDAAGLIPS